MKKLISILAIFSMLFCCSAMSCSFAAEPATKKTATTQVSKLKKAGAAAAAATAAVVAVCVAWGCSKSDLPESSNNATVLNNETNNATLLSNVTNNATSNETGSLNETESLWSKAYNFVSDHKGEIVGWIVNIGLMVLFSRTIGRGPAGQNGRNGKAPKLPENMVTGDNFVDFLDANADAIRGIVEKKES